MKWKILLRNLQEYVPSGKITTYGNLSEKLYGHRRAAQSIAAMLKAAINEKNENKL